MEYTEKIFVLILSLLPDRIISTDLPSFFRCIIIQRKTFVFKVNGAWGHWLLKSKAFCKLRKIALETLCCLKRQYVLYEIVCLSLFSKKRKSGQELHVKNSYTCQVYFGMYKIITMPLSWHYPFNWMVFLVALSL